MKVGAYIRADSASDAGTVFISYSHQDAAALARLRVYLTPYVRSGAIPLWDDTAQAGRRMEA